MVGYNKISYLLENVTNMWHFRILKEDIMEQRYLELLAHRFVNKQEVISEIINLKTILSLPKGTEFFFSDLHGEHSAFLHLLKSASGVIKDKIDLLFQCQLSSLEREKLAHFIYYPQKQLELLPLQGTLRKRWYEKTIIYLIQLAKFCSTKYTRSKVYKKLPKEFAYIMQEMLSCYESEYMLDYYHQIIVSLLEINCIEIFMISLCEFIQRICIDYIHIIGDIFDRGPRPDLIIDELMTYDQVDIQWGNHDISWMGAACGQPALVANVVRIALSYNHLDLLEIGYGINLRALSDFAREVYQTDSCLSFQPHVLDKNKYDKADLDLVAKMYKAITIIQLKLEGQLIHRYPNDYQDKVIWLEKIDFQSKNVKFMTKTYPLKDDFLPTVSHVTPLILTKKENQLMETLIYSFQKSQRLQNHIHFLYTHGHMYKTMNQNLMFHGCIPLDHNGNFKEILIQGKILKGKALLDELQCIAKRAYYEHKQEDIDMMWFLWCSSSSPLFGKSQLTLFEKHFLDDKHLQQENMDPYYKWIEKESTCQMILNHFGITKGHIINGHVPVRIKDGQKPIKANGLLYVIDGGISKTYQEKTGNAGYTLIFDSQHLKLAQHLPYQKSAKEGLLCLTPKVEIIQTYLRIKNKDCDIGNVLKSQINDLKELLVAYQKGIVKENSFY